MSLGARTRRLFEIVANDFGRRSVAEYLLPHLAAATESQDASTDSIKAGLEDPKRCLAAFFAHYAFARRGKDREDLARITVESLGEVAPSGTLPRVDAAGLWRAFEARCTAAGRKPHEQQNRGIIQGMLELAVEVDRGTKPKSIAHWVVSTAQETGRLEKQFERIVDIRGLGPKCTSTFLRDLVLLYELEDVAEARDRIYFQPIDRWVRAIAPVAVPEPRMDDAADWILAGKLAKYARIAGVSGILFNMGSTYLGQRLIRDVSAFQRCLREFLEGSSPELILPTPIAGEPPQDLAE